MPIQLHCKIPLPQRITMFSSSGIPLFFFYLFFIYFVFFGYKRVICNYFILVGKKEGSKDWFLLRCVFLLGKEDVIAQIMCLLFAFCMSLFFWRALS
uniref:Uncharacterized protein n=1 Tax=Rhizophora mucronata TaxID=61149 RepID=A0A2P2MAN6_RHIMU